METADRYPIGQQDFKTLRMDGAIYIDKTRFVEKIASSKSKYYFLARPRRFGKSLFLSTLRYFFEGERSLFKNLHIDGVEWNWERNPVLYLDFNTGEYSDPGNLDRIIDSLLSKWEKTFQIEPYSQDNTLRFCDIIEAAHLKTGKQVVILVDEYDKPLVKNIDREEFDLCREKLGSLYSNFKTCAEHIRLVFMTGVSRFSKLSVFSGLNNLKDITFSNEYADICGITEKELYENLKPGIAGLAEKYKISYSAALGRLKKNYDGYRFAEEGSDIYNPWSLFNCLSEKKLSNYWNETGFPTLVAKSLKSICVDLEDVFDTYCDEKDLKGLDLTDLNPIALMYQTGYLTIKDYDITTNLFHLGIPNFEVKEGLVNVLLPYYAKFQSEAQSSKTKDFVKWLKIGKPDKFLEAMQTYFAGVSYMLKMDNENNFHNAFFLITSLIGLETDAEIHTSDGRIDMTIKTPGFIYIIELKYDKSAEDALLQIDSKKYERMFLGDMRKIFKIGVNFSSTTRTIEDWKIN